MPAVTIELTEDTVAPSHWWVKVTVGERLVLHSIYTSFVQALDVGGRKARDAARIESSRG